ADLDLPRERVAQTDVELGHRVPRPPLLPLEWLDRDRAVDLFDGRVAVARAHPVEAARELFGVDMPFRDAIRKKEARVRELARLGLLALRIFHGDLRDTPMPRTGPVTIHDVDHHCR